MKVSFSPVQLQHTAAERVGVDADHYTTDVDVDGEPQTVLVTVSGHSTLGVSRGGDTAQREGCINALVADMIAHSLPDIPAKVSIGATNQDLTVSTPQMEDGRYLVPSL